MTRAKIRGELEQRFRDLWTGNNRLRGAEIAAMLGVTPVQCAKAAHRLKLKRHPETIKAFGAEARRRGTGRRSTAMPPDRDVRTGPVTWPPHRFEDDPRAYRDGGVLRIVVPERMSYIGCTAAMAAD